MAGPRGRVSFRRLLAEEVHSEGPQPLSRAKALQKRRLRGKPTKESLNRRGPPCHVCGKHPQEYLTGGRCLDCWAQAAQRWMWQGRQWNAFRHP
jgi:hypothetical protein